MDLHLEGRHAVVTGAGRGIGLAITRALTAEGAHVTAGSRSITPELDELRAAGKVSPIRVDLASTDGPAHLIDTAARQSPIDVLVNNVGNATVRLEGFGAITDEQWLATINLTFFAAVRATRAALPAMIARGSGRIVTVCSVNSFLPDPGVIDYCAAKAALANFSKALSKEVGPHGIRVNTVSPGPVETDLWLGEHGVATTVGRRNHRDPAAIISAQAADTATGRFSRADEVADLVVLLAGDAAGNVTGTDLVIDGGLIKTLR
jgi:NAD(P)-dependent dehydrogenase (short-subunit alcohol dehydrogenase family)